MVIFLNPPTSPWLGFLWKSGGGPDAEGLTPVGAWLLCDSLSCLPTFMVHNSSVGACLEHTGCGKHAWGVVWNPSRAGGRTANREQVSPGKAWAYLRLVMPQSYYSPRNTPKQGKRVLIGFR